MAPTLALPRAHTQGMEHAVLPPQQGAYRGPIHPFGFSLTLPPLRRGRAGNGASLLDTSQLAGRGGEGLVE